MRSESCRLMNWSSELEIDAEATPPLASVRLNIAISNTDFRSAMSGGASPQRLAAFNVPPSLKSSEFARLLDGLVRFDGRQAWLDLRGTVRRKVRRETTFRARRARSIGTARVPGAGFVPPGAEPGVKGFLRRCGLGSRGGVDRPSAGAIADAGADVVAPSLARDAGVTGGPDAATELRGRSCTPRASWQAGARGRTVFSVGRAHWR